VVLRNHILYIAEFFEPNTALWTFHTIQSCSSYLELNFVVKVLDQESQSRQKKVKYNSLVPGEDDPVNESATLVHEKRTRFSLSHDQDSIG